MRQSHPSFDISAANDECSVTYTGNKQYETAILTATVMLNNTVVNIWKFHFN